MINQILIPEKLVPVDSVACNQCQEVPVWDAENPHYCNLHDKSNN